MRDGIIMWPLSNLIILDLHEAVVVHVNLIYGVLTCLLKL